MLGAPATAAFEVPGGNGCYRHYENGSVYWAAGERQAFEVHGDIRWQWSNLGWEAGYLGFPLTDEITTPDGIGRYNHFQGGSLYWKPELGAHPVINGFRGYWAEHGWERYEALGYPLNAEMPSFPATPHR